MDCICYLSHGLLANWNVVVVQIHSFHHRRWIRIQDDSGTKGKLVKLGNMKISFFQDFLCGYL